MSDLNLKQIDWIATEATSRLRRECMEYDLPVPRKFSPGEVRIVLAAAETLRAEETKGWKKEL